jgi:hypothetical protein
MLAIAGLAALGVVAMPLSSGAVNFASFQLDGNTTGDDDWDALYPSSSVFNQDGSGSGDDQLVQGTADKLDFDRWTWRSQAVTPPKSDIQWAYATPAVVNNELVLYFGSDRANDDKAGSVNVGFWFLQGDVGPQSGGSFGPDRHKPGDVFVAAEIDSGGRVANIAVYKWDPSASKNLALQTSGSYGECNGSLGSLVACGIANNSSSISTAWRGSVANPYFFEGGINISKLFSGAPPCFSSFLSNTRSSFSVDAAGQDIAGGNIDTCGRIVISKTTVPSQSPSFDFSTTGAAPLTGFQLAGGGTKEFTSVSPGAYTVEETSLPADWSFASLNCPTVSGSGTSAQVSGGKVSISLGFFGDVECTYVNKRKPEVKLVKDFEGTGTPIDLKLGDTVKGTFSADGDTGFFTVEPGQYTASEAFQQPNGGLYTTTSKCVTNGSDPGFGAGLSQGFTAAPGDQVVCTFKNVRKTVQVTTVKDFVGTPSPISIAAGPQSKSITGDDQVSATVEAGTSQGLSETLTDGQKALYDTTVQCTGDQASQAGVYSRQLDVGTDPVSCTFVNNRKHGTLEIRKDFADPGTQRQIELRLDGATKATLTADGTTGPLTVDTGAYTASEAFTTASDGDLYTSTYTCTRNGNPYVAQTSGRSVQVDVGKGDAVVCTFKNDRRNVNVTVEKDWVGTVTPVELFVGGTKKTVSAEPATLTVAVPAGSSTTVGESAVPSDYDAFVHCGSAADVAYTGPVALANVTAPVTCVVTNKELPQVKVTKDLEPASDPGRFDLQVGGVTRADNAGDGGTTGFVHVAPTGSLTVGELAGDGSTDLSKYSSSIACDTGKGGSQAKSHTFAVAYGDKVSCVITNSRLQGQVTVNKVWLPAEAKGAVTLQIGPSTQAFAAGDTQSFSKSLNTGSVVSVGEPTIPAGFDAFIDCTGDQAAEAAGSTLDVAVGETPVTCTVTNKRKPQVKVTKVLDPTTDPGKFDLQVNGKTEKDDAGNGGTTGLVRVDPGQATVGELAGTATSLDDYHAQISCGAKGDGQAGATSYSFAVGYGDRVECTITNARETGTIEVVKVYETPEGQQVPAPYSSVNLNVDGVTKATAPAKLTTGAVQVNTGSHVASEAFVDADDADLYSSTGVCRLGEQEVGTVSGNGRSITGVAVGDGDAVVCTFTNTRKARSIEVTKSVSESANGTFDSEASKPEPGGTFYFHVTVKNTSAADVVTITGLQDLVDGLGAVSADDLVCDIGDGSFPFQLDPGESVVCSFTRDVVGNPRSETDHVEASWKDEEGQPQPDEPSNDAVVTITNVAPTIAVDKVVTGPGSRQTPGGSFSYRVTIVNQSLVEDVTITDLDDFVDTDGSVNGTGTPGASITMNGLDCAVPLVIAKGGSKVCTFTATVNGPAGKYFDVVVVNGADDEGTPTTADDDASVTLTPTPPPPPPPPSSTPVIDVQVIKDATPQVQLGKDGKATITYSALVKNNGPNMANEVQLADPAPSGVAFGAITKQPDFGSCQISAVLLSCKLGTMGYGVQTLITWTATVSVTGTVTNTATATGTGGVDRVPANNVDDATTLVVAPVTPPKPKPKPKPRPKPHVKPHVKPKPVICAMLTVQPKLVRADGQKQTIRAVVRAKRKALVGVKVHVVGPKLKLTAKTDRKGVARFTVRPGKAGIIQVRITGRKACNTQRLGVVGVFQPPLTG